MQNEIKCISILYRMINKLTLNDCQTISALGDCYKVLTS